MGVAREPRCVSTRLYREESITCRGSNLAKLLILRTRETISDRFLAFTVTCTRHGLGVDALGARGEDEDIARKTRSSRRSWRLRIKTRERSIIVF